MDIATIKDWLVPVATFATLITASISGWLTLKEYRLKVMAETRLSESTQLESDIKLLKLFTEMMNIAHARGGTQISEKAIERLLSPELIKELGITKGNLREALENAVFNYPIGRAAQDSAICAIWVLGNRHEVLKPVAIQALTSLAGFKPEVATPYLEELKSNHDGKWLATSDLKGDPDFVKRAGNSIARLVL